MPDVLYVPRIANLEWVDAFFVAREPWGYSMVVIQTTVGKMHPVKVNGHDILLAYGEEARAHLVHKALIFVLPAHGVLYKVQLLHT